MSQYSFLKKTVLFILIIMLALIPGTGCGLKDPVVADTTEIILHETFRDAETAIIETGGNKNTETTEADDGILNEETKEEGGKKEEKLTEEQIIARERLLLESQLKERLGIFYVSLPPYEKKDNPPIKAKGIYVTANSAGLEPRFENFIDMIDKTELNAMVIDVKNDHGLMTYPSQVPVVAEVMTGHFEPVRDINALIARLEEKNIYPIARIVVFRDPYLPGFYPEWAIQNKEGGAWKDRKGFYWMNPYEKKVWDYNIAIAKEAALAGFKEIQFDYVRFPEGAESLEAQSVFPGRNDVLKDEIIRDFLIYASEELKDYNVYVSADVFGVIATYFGDKDGIGQDWLKISEVADYIYPMVYPSHYSSGFFGLSVPDARPKQTILNAMKDAIKRNSTLENPACIRPWLQGFTATWIRGNIRYGPQQIREQIEAVQERGIDEFFIWNASNRYNIDSFLTEEEAEENRQFFKSQRENMGLDHTGNNSSDAFDEYMDYINKKNFKEAYLLQSTGFTMDLEHYGNWASDWTFDSVEVDIISSKDLNLKTVYEADIVFKKENMDFSLKKLSFEVFIENNVWKTRPPAVFIESMTRKYSK